MKLRIAAALIVAVWSSAALAAASPDEGHRLAREWCSSCHQVDPDGPMRDYVPSFVSLANRPDRTLAWVRLWLTDPHPPMTGLNLSRAQIEDVIAYLYSLQTPPAR